MHDLTRRALAVLALALGTTACDGKAPERVPAAKEAPTTFEADATAALAALKAADNLTGRAREAELARALGLLDRLLVIAPLDEQLHFWRGIAGVMAHEESVARSSLAKLSGLPNVGDRHPLRAFLGAQVVLEFNEDQPIPALKALRTLRAEAPKFMPEPVERALYTAHLKVGTAMVKVERMEEAIPYFEEAKRMVAEDPVRGVHARRILADVLGRVGRYIEAIEEYDELIAWKGEFADFRAARGALLAMQSLWQQAVVEYTRALDLAKEGKVYDPEDAFLQEALLRRANCHRLLEHPEQALADLSLYRTAFPDDHRALRWLGVLYMEDLHDLEKAKQCLEQAYAAAPYCEPYLNTLVTLYEMYLPDAARAEELRRLIDTGKDQRTEARRQMTKVPGRSRMFCE